MIGIRNHTHNGGKLYAPRTCAEFSNRVWRLYACRVGDALCSRTWVAGEHTALLRGAGVLSEGDVQSPLDSICGRKDFQGGVSNVFGSYHAFMEALVEPALMLFELV